VKQHKHLLAEQYFSGGGTDVLNDVRSAGKSITALAVGLAISDRKLKGVDSPVLAEFADLAPFAHASPVKDAITVEDLLTMSSAFECNDWDDASPGNEERMYQASYWTRFVVDMPIKADYKRDDTGHGPFSYCTAGAFLLGQLIQRVTGERIDQYIERRLFQPLGIEKVQWRFSPVREVLTGGQTRYRAQDLVKLGQLVLDDGNWLGRQVLPASWIHAMLTARRRADKDDDYGYFWWRRDFHTIGSGRAHSGWYMSGNGGNKVVLFSDLDALVVVTSTNYNTRGMHQQTTELVERFVLPALEANDASSH